MLGGSSDLGIEPSLPPSRINTPPTRPGVTDGLVSPGTVAPAIANNASAKLLWLLLFKSAALLVLDRNPRVLAWGVAAGGILVSVMAVGDVLVATGVVLNRTWLCCEPGDGDWGKTDVDV